MRIQAEISIYPLRTQSLSKPIEEFCRILSEQGLEIKTTAMSTFVSGESTMVFKACQEAFEHASDTWQVVMNMKISNACPSDG